MMASSRERIRGALRDKFEPRQMLLDGRVTAAPLVDGRSAGYVVAHVAGVAGVRVACDPDLQPPLAPGDTITVRQYGSPSAADLAVVQRTAGLRSDAGLWQFTQDTSVFGESFAAGDVLLGSNLSGMPNWWYVYALGQWQMRIGSDLRGAIGNLDGIYDVDETLFGVAFGDPAGEWMGIDEGHGLRVMWGETELQRIQGRVHVLGENNQPRLKLSPGLIEFLDGAGETQMALDGTTRTIYGVERLGYPLGPGIELGATLGGRYRWAVLGEDGAPFWSVVSGTTADPNDVSWRAGSDDAAEFVQLRDGRLTWAAQNASLDSDGILHASGAILDGTITANAGTIGGWTLSNTQLAATAGNMWINGATGYIDTSGAGIDGSGTWRLWAGSNRAGAASAPFRVNSSGDVYLTSVKALTASNSTGWVIDVSSTSATLGCIRATGTNYGLDASGTVGAKGSGGGIGVYGVSAEGHGVRGESSGGIAVYADGILESTTALHINGTKVVGTRVIDARCDDTVNSGDATTDGVIDALRDAMIAHGLIAAA